MDITEVIAHQHEEQRRGFAQLEEFPRDDTEGLEALWQRLEVLLETHAEAEERFFYPWVLELGTGAADAPDAEEETEDAVSDHDDLRRAIRRVRDAEVGSPQWWTAVIDANVANSDHMAEEERQDLADMRQQASLQLRHDIAVQFLRFQAIHARDGVPPQVTGPEDYLEEHGSDGQHRQHGEPSLRASETG